MGLAGLEIVRPKARITGGVRNRRYMPSIEMLHQQQCNVCPLNLIQTNHNPHMLPTGSENPIIYVLGEAPGENEDEEGKQFVGKSGYMLRSRIQREWFDHIRWNNAVRTRPPENRDPTYIEIECCRPSIVADIERTKPEAIFGFGGVALNWALGVNGITLWAGRHIPIKVGSHHCWFFPMMHPAYVGYMRKQSERSGDDIEFAFGFHLKRAFDLIYELPEPVVHSAEDVLANIEIVNGSGGDEDLNRVKHFLRSRFNDPYLGLDYETEGSADKKLIRPQRGGKILSASFSNGDRTMAYALDHPQAGWSSKQIKQIHDLHADFLRRYRGVKIAHNTHFEMEWSAHHYGVDLIWGTKWADTMSQAYVLNETPGMLSLEDLVLQHFGINIKKLNSLNKDRLQDEPIDEVLRYNGSDSKYAKHLHYAQYLELREEDLLQSAADHFLRVPTNVIKSMKGIPVDQECVQTFTKEYLAKLRDTEDKIAMLPAVKRFRQIKHADFRPSAPLDLKFMFKNILHRVVDKVDEPTLKDIDEPIVKAVLYWREINKLWSTYVKPLLPASTPLLPEGNPDSELYADGLLHPITKTMAVRTTRTSAEDINYQNSPKHEHQEVRSQMKHKFKKLVTFDYSGIQARNVAMESRCPVLTKAFWNDYNIHLDWMERIERMNPGWIPAADVGVKDKTKYWRNRAKNGLVFPCFFGAGANKVAFELGIDLNAAYKLLDEFWYEFAAVRKWHDRVRESYRRDGYVTSLARFRRHCPISQNELINSGIQADEAIIVCQADAELSQLAHAEGNPDLQAEMIIHDDLSFWWDKKDIERNSEIVIQHMLLTPFEWAHVVPIQLETSVGDDWASTHEIGVFKTTSPTEWIEVKK